MMAQSFFPILYFEKAKPVASAFAGRASSFQSDVIGPAWLRSSFGNNYSMRELIVRPPDHASFI